MRRRVGLAPLHLDELPRLAVLDDQEVHLAPVSVANVLQRHVAAFVLDALGLLQQRAGDQVLEARPLVAGGHGAVVEVVLRRLQQGAGDVAVPRRNAKDDVEVFQQFKPVLHGVAVLLQIAGKRIHGERAADAVPQQLDERLDGHDVAHGGEVQQVLAQDDVHMGTSPASVPTLRTAQERLREPAHAQQQLQCLRRFEASVGDGLLQIERVQAVVEVPAGQGIPHLLERGEPGAAGDQQRRGQPLDVVDALQPRLPIRHLVEFVEDDQRLASVPRLLLQQQAMLRRVVIQVLVVRLDHARERGLAALPGAGEEDDLLPHVRGDGIVGVSGQIRHAGFLSAN